MIVGAGPGGLSAAVYAARAGLAPVVIAPSDGGQLLGKGVTVENYPGIVQRPFLAYPVTRRWRGGGATATMQADATRRPPTLNCGADAVASMAWSRWAAFRFECPREYDARRADGVGAAAPI